MQAADLPVIQTDTIDQTSSFPTNTVTPEYTQYANHASVGVDRKDQLAGQILNSAERDRLGKNVFQISKYEREKGEFLELAPGEYERLTTQNGEVIPGYFSDFSKDFNPRDERYVTKEGLNRANIENDVWWGYGKKSLRTEKSFPTDKFGIVASRTEISGHNLPKCPSKSKMQSHYDYWSEGAGSILSGPGADFETDRMLRACSLEYGTTTEFPSSDKNVGVVNGGIVRMADNCWRIGCIVPRNKAHEVISRTMNVPIPPVIPDSVWHLAGNIGRASEGIGNAVSEMSNLIDTTTGASESIQNIKDRFYDDIDIMESFRASSPRQSNSSRWKKNLS